MTLQDKQFETHITHQGYEGIGLAGRLYLIHRLLAEQYLLNIDNKPCVNHKDGNKLNNSLDNLEWVTYSENTRHAFATGLRHNYYPKPAKRKPVGSSDGKIYKSIREASEQTGIICTSIANCLSTRSKQAGGLQWRYL